MRDTLSKLKRSKLDVKEFVKKVVMWDSEDTIQKAVIKIVSLKMRR